MEDPKAQFRLMLIEAVAGITTNVFSMWPETLVDMPVVIYSVRGNTPIYHLDSGIAKQDYDIMVDLFGKTDEDTIAMASAIEARLRQAKYRLAEPGAIEIPDPKDYSHLNLRFVY